MNLVKCREPLVHVIRASSDRVLRVFQLAASQSFDGLHGALTLSQLTLASRLSNLLSLRSTPRRVGAWGW